ncbi:NYN domain-containing protein [Vibrio sp. PP-XX7]
MQEKEKIAVFIDADNAPAKKIDKVLSELARCGVVNIRKAYGNWTNPALKVLARSSSRICNSADSAV